MKKINDRANTREMKTRIEVSCTEEHLIDSLIEVRSIIDVTDISSIELKVFHDKNRDQHKGLSWVTVTDKSNPNELYQIYELKKKIAELTDNSPI